jgi:transglutaminase-like putative cysteine protease
MKYRMRHSTLYTYSRPVDLSSHILHLTPRSLPRQRVLSHALHPTPGARRLSNGIDHFGNVVTRLFLEGSHKELDVTAEAMVEVTGTPPPAAVLTPPWEAVVRAAATGWQVAEFTFPSAMAPDDAAVGAYAAQSFTPGRPVLAALIDLSSRINRDFKFRSGVTDIATPVSRVLAERAGVCQDFSHLMIVGLRALGLPARYVSGYLRTKPRPGQKRRIGADASHAWVGAWLGAEFGWVDFDPTNDLIVQDEHIVVAWGRDYGDVSPMYGIILGGGAHTLKVGVDLEPIDDQED